MLVTIAGSIGIYVGRFLRWNSWSLFQAPLTLADAGWDRVSQPDAGELMLGFAVLFALLFLFVYAVVYVLARPRGDEPGRDGGRGSGDADHPSLHGPMGRDVAR